MNLDFIHLFIHFGAKLINKNKNRFFIHKKINIVLEGNCTFKNVYCHISFYFY